MEEVRLFLKLSPQGTEFLLSSTLLLPLDMEHVKHWPTENFTGFT